MKKNSNRYNLLDCQKGSVIMTFAAFLLLAMPLIGLFITYGFGVVARTNVQGAMDSAAIAASLDKNIATRDATAQRYYDANYKAGFFGSVATFGTDVTANIGPVNGATTIDSKNTAKTKTPFSAFLKGKKSADDGSVPLTSHVSITGDLANNPADLDADMVIVLNTFNPTADMNLPNKSQIQRDVALKLVLGAFIGNALEKPATTKLEIGMANNAFYRGLSKNRKNFIGLGFTFGEQADGSYQYYNPVNGFIGVTATQDSDGCVACSLAGAVEMLGLVVPQNSLLSGGVATRTALKIYRNNLSPPAQSGGDKFRCAVDYTSGGPVAPVQKANCKVDFSSNLVGSLIYKSGQVCNGADICNTTPIDWLEINKPSKIYGEDTLYELRWGVIQREFTVDQATPTVITRVKKSKVKVAGVEKLRTDTTVRTVTQHNEVIRTEKYVDTPSKGIIIPTQISFTPPVAKPNTIKVNPPTTVFSDWVPDTDLKPIEIINVLSQTNTDVSVIETKGWIYANINNNFIGVPTIAGYAGYPKNLADKLRLIPSGANANKVVVLITDTIANRTIDGAPPIPIIHPNTDVIATIEMLDMCRVIKNSGAKIHSVGLGTTFAGFNVLLSKPINYNGITINNFKDALNYCDSSGSYTQIDSTDRLYDFLWQRAGGLPSDLNITR